MADRRWFGILAVAMTIGLGYVVYSAYRSSNSEHCYACQRPIHMHSRTIALVNGRPKLFCCPACALSEHEQAGKPIRIVELTSFLTGAKLSPNEALVVRGSDVNMCALAHGPLDADKRTMDVHYDRCSPSLLAFAQSSEAVQFAREHGGEAVPFSEVVTAFFH